MAKSWGETGVIETYSGEPFDVLNPDPAAVRLGDIAAGLAHTCRFGGQCQQFYSVATHSLLVSREFDDPRRQTLGLLHDAAEAYVGDVPRPLKHRYEDFETIEQEVLDAVWAGLGIEPPTDQEWQAVMTADDRLLSYEAANLLADGSWAGETPQLAYDLDSPIDEARERFRTRAETLLADLSAEDV